MIDLMNYDNVELVKFHKHTIKGLQCIEISFLVMIELHITKQKNHDQSNLTALIA